MIEYTKTSNFEKLKNYVKNGKNFHAIIINSEDEFTNFAMSKLLSMLLLCDNVCFSCENCKKIINDSHPDLKIFPENDSFLVADANKIVEEASIKPIFSDKKIFILHNFDNATVQAQNKLLKTIEEPYDNVIFIFTAVNCEKILQTILSRTQQFKLSKFSKEELKMFTEKSLTDEIYALSAGWPGKLNNIEDCLIANFDFIKNLIKNLKSSKDVINFSQDFAEDKNSFSQKLNILLNIFRDALMQKLNKHNLINYKTEVVSLIANEYSQKAIIKCIQLIDNAQKQFLSKANLNLIADNLLISILEVKHLCK